MTINKLLDSLFSEDFFSSLSSSLLKNDSKWFECHSDEDYDNKSISSGQSEWNFFVVVSFVLFCSQRSESKKWKTCYLIRFLCKKWTRVANHFNDGNRLQLSSWFGFWALKKHLTWLPWINTNHSKQWI